VETVTRHVELPKLVLQPFDGDILKWQSWWESYENAVHNQKLPDVDKFNYLKMYLKGEAEKAVGGLSLTAASYAQAIQILKEEYGNTKIIIEARLMQLYKLHDGPKHRDIQGLKQLYTELNMHIRELTALGHPIDSLGSFIVTLLLQRMPADMQQIWWQGEERGPTDHKEIMEFVQKQITIRQRVSRIKYKRRRKGKVQIPEKRGHRTTLRNQPQQPSRQELNEYKGCQCALASSVTKPRTRAENVR